MFYIRAHLYMCIAFVNTALWREESFQTQQRRCLFRPVIKTMLPVGVLYSTGELNENPRDLVMHRYSV